ncbi:hypothetical protein [Reyranella sp. CPCC 100927]|uniref:hypothetical protein n=1 Tax=Reyranella sp. CPCC 100927 TaxID=2599616 RepID=UPI0011B5B123|nr:hypothetical protein [Reyranella sp. CPCC 100927]TWT11425.1 hypothetical protein FQU96_13120 [Reyranella sp. CPCC 100927]
MCVIRSDVRVAFLLSFALPVWQSPAHAAGGAHVVDDAGVETPGLCHLETWLTRGGPRSGLVNASPACTFEALPRLEVGATVQRTWARGAHTSDTLVGPTLKLNLWPVESGFGVGLAGATAWSVRAGHWETASLIVPVSISLHERLRVNFNAGWLYSRSGAQRNEAFLGAQVEAAIAADVMLMGEVFGRDRGRPGAQIGVRWTPGGGRWDVDLLSGWRTDGVTPWSMTLGLTVRF